jgi:hypothetical protein
MNWSFGCCNHHHRHPVFLHGKNCSFDRTMLDRYGPHWSSLILNQSYQFLYQFCWKIVPFSASL